MQFLCMGYFDPEKMGDLSPEAVDALMRECQPHMQHLYHSATVLLDAGVDVQTHSLRRTSAGLEVAAIPLEATRLRVGSVFIIEASDLQEALRLAALHPTGQLEGAQQYGWGIEVRPIHYLKL